MKIQIEIVVPDERMKNVSIIRTLNKLTDYVNYAQLEPGHHGRVMDGETGATAEWRVKE